MKFRLALSTALLALSSVSTHAAQPPIRVILVGDSTLAPNNGYGDALCQRFSAEVTCINLAKNGRSSGSYRAEGSWQKVQALLADKGSFAASYVLVEFGHNDQPGKPGRSTDLKTEFPVNIGRYVDDIRAAGGTPVLATPLTRRSFVGPRLVNDLQPWADATARVAAEQRVPLIDLLTASAAAVQAMGSAQADTLAVEPPPPATGASASAPASAPASSDLAQIERVTTAKSAFDHTHVGPKGARLFAGIVAGLMQDAVPSLRAYFKNEAAQ